MKPAEFFDVESLLVRVEAGLTDEERFLRSGCFGQEYRDGRLAILSDPRAVVVEIKESYTLEVILVRIGFYVRIWQALSMLYRSGLWLLSFEELTAFASQYPDKQYEHPIVGIYETATGVGTFGYANYVLSADRKFRQRSFVVLASGDGIGENCWLAVKEGKPPNSEGA